MSRIVTALQNEHKSFIVFASMLVVAILAATLLYSPLPLVVPLACIFLAGTILSPKHLFYLFFVILPFSVEVQIGSLGTDLPSEPLMVFMMGVALVLFITKSRKISKAYFIHPMSLVMVLHIAWIIITSLTSTIPLYSFKFLLAKLWYVIPFFYLPLLVMKNEKDFKKVFLYLAIGLNLAMTYVLVKHAGEGFSFESANFVMAPIFRNHVNYAIMLVAFLPYLWYLVQTGKKMNWIVKMALVVYLLVAIYFSFTRAAQASVLLAVVFHYVIKWRLIKPAIGLAFAGAVLLIMHLGSNNKYLDYAPDFSKAISHKKFDNLMEATTKMQDVSTVERFYRWIAGAYMVTEKPITGFGPSTFYPNYDGYTVTSYRTYVSDNPEKSGIHNNYLMVAAEQGLPGLFIFLLLVFLPLLYAEKTYHLLNDVGAKALVMASATCYFLIDVTILINELIEVDKIGPLYFLSASIILYYSVNVKSRARGRIARP